MEKSEIKVEESIPTAKGVNFMLYPIQGLHTEQDVEDTKSELNRLRDVITIRVIWLHDPKAVQQWKEASCQNS